MSSPSPYLSSTRILISRGKGVGLPLTNRETDVVMTLMSGNTSHEGIATALGVKRGTIHFNFNQIYAKTGAKNHADLILMIAGAKACPNVLLLVQRQWRRKHYRIDE